MTKITKIRALHQHFSSNARIIRAHVLNTSDLATLAYLPADTENFLRGGSRDTLIFFVLGDFREGGGVK